MSHLNPRNEISRLMMLMWKAKATYTFAGKNIRKNHRELHSLCMKVLYGLMTSSNVALCMTLHLNPSKFIRGCVSRNVGSNAGSY